MAFDDVLASRVRSVFKNRRTTTEEKRMMGGLCFMVAGKMCVGIAGSRLMVRLDPTLYEEALGRPGCEPMDFTGKPLRGFVFVRGESIVRPQALIAWIDLALEFNPRAKASRTSKPSKKPSAQSRQRAATKRSRRGKP